MFNIEIIRTYWKIREGGLEGQRTHAVFDRVSERQFMKTMPANRIDQTIEAVNFETISRATSDL